MDDKDTIVVVGATEKDQYGNLWVTPQGGGDKIKIAKKRENLHQFMEQGRAILLHWETYMNKPYVSDAKPVEGELPPPVKPPVLESGNPPPEVKQAEKTSDSLIISSAKDRHIARLNSMNNACLLASKGLVPLGDLGLWASQIERYNSGELDASQLDANLQKMLGIKD